MNLFGREHRKKELISFVIFGVLFWILSSKYVAFAACVEHDIKNAKEAAAIISDHWEEDYFGEIIVSRNSNRIKVDDKSETFTKTFSTSDKNRKEAVSSENSLESFLNQKKEKEGEIYEVEEVAKGKYSVKAPYQSKRIVIQSGKVEEDFGAVEKYVYEEAGKTILIFETAKKTKIAYQKICKKYGKKHCYVDEIIQTEKLTQATECYTWGGSLMGMDTLRTEQKVIGKAPVTVAVLDTGIDSSNIIFQGKKILSSSYNFVRGSYDVKDLYGHGTHVAGIIANLTPDNVQFLILKVANDRGQSTALSVDLALDYAISKKADVINISMGFMSSDAKYYTFLDESINEAYKKGIPVCVAAGNDDEKYSFGKRVDNCYPACNSQAITVSSLDKNKNLAWYSCCGSSIDFAAPGTDVISAGLNGKFMSNSGTSMAAPHISAAMAYVKLSNKQLSVDGCCMELRKRCVDLGAKGWDSSYGYGYPRLGDLFQSAGSYGDWIVSKNLSAPILLSCSNVKSGVKLTWKAVAKAEGYNIYCKRNGEIACRIGRVGGKQTQYVDTSAKDGHLNLYYIEAYGKRTGGETVSGRSNYLSTLTLRTPTFAALKTWKRKNLAVTLKKNALRKEKSVQIQYSKQKNFKKSKSKVYSSVKNTFKFNPNMRGIIYVRVRTVESVNRQKFYSAWTTVKKVKVK